MRAIALVRYTRGPGEVHQGQSEPKVTPVRTAGTGAEDRPRFAIPPRPDMLSARRRHGFGRRVTPGVGLSTSLRLSRRGHAHHRPQETAGLSQNGYGHTYILKWTCAYTCTVLLASSKWSLNPFNDFSLFLSIFIDFSLIFIDFY